MQLKRFSQFIAEQMALTGDEYTVLAELGLLDPDTEAVRQIVMAYKGGDLDLRDFTGVEQLPPGKLKIEGDLFLSGCAKLTHLPQVLSVGDCCYLSGCSSLTHLPNELSVGSELDLSGCSSLTHLPDGLSVWNLYLDGCTGLTRLPDGLTVGRNLLLKGCPALVRDRTPAEIRAEIEATGGSVGGKILI